MKQRKLLAVAVCLAAWQVACGGGGGGQVSQPPPPLAITVASSSPNVDAGSSVNLSASVSGGSGNATVTWSANPSVGSFSFSTGTSTAWTAPATLTASPETVTLTATATDGSGSNAQTASANVAETVARVITLNTSPSNEIPNNELYLDFGAIDGYALQCTGCVAGDTLSVQGSWGGVATTTFASGFSNPWEELVNFVGPAYVPGPISMWITGTDGAKSNTLWLTFDGSQNEAVQDPSTGEIYYLYSGNGTLTSGEIMNFRPDGTADGDEQASSGEAAVAFDNQNQLLDVTFPAPLNSTLNGIYPADVTTWTGKNMIPLTNGEPGAISASDNLVCVTIPTGGTAPNGTDAVDCNDSGGTFTLPGIPAGSQPAAIKVLDANDVVVYGRGDSTLRWYTVSGTSATAAGTLQLSQFTKTDASYWKQYPATGGWDLTEVGTTLAVMGEVVNGDGTVSQKLALVDNATQKFIQDVSLPAGTIHIAPDPTNNAVVAEYPDFTVSPPITRFKRVYMDTGNSTDLASTSTTVPGAGFLVTQDGSTIVVCGGGKCDFRPNQ